MLYIKFGFGGIMHKAEWNATTEEWISDDARTQGILQKNYEIMILPQLYRDAPYMEGGVSGQVWKYLQEYFPHEVELVLLQPEPPPDKPKPGVYD